MKMQIGKWGDSLVVRLPRELVECFNLKEGDAIDSASVELALLAAETEEAQARRAAALKTIEEQAFALPPDWKFDREGSELAS